MVLGPVADARNDPLPDTATPPPELPARARAIAERFVAAMTAAEQATTGWTDEPLTFHLVDAASSTALHELAATGCWGRANQLASSELWRIAGPWLETGWLQHRARFKPRGYAGDDHLLAALWERTLCTHPLGRAFDQVFQRQAAVEAVRARIEQTASAVVESVLASAAEPYRIVSLGSGPAIELELAARSLPERRRQALRVTLLDLDEEALASAARRLRAYLPPEHVSCRRENLFRVASRPQLAALLAGADFSYCLGLFDYLNDEPAIALLRAMHAGLRAGGRVFVGNFAPHNPSRAYMEWIGNWYLLYRTADELRSLATRAGLPDEHLRIAADRTGIDLFISARACGSREGLLT